MRTLDTTRRLSAAGLGHACILAHSALVFFSPFVSVRFQRSKLKLETLKTADCGA